jgi:hypothetical protein
MKYFILLLILNIVYCNYIHHFNCNFEKENRCYTNTPLFDNFNITIQIIPIKYNKLEQFDNDCILFGCNECIKFDETINYNWTCIGEPSIKCNNINLLNGFIYW